MLLLYDRCVKCQKKGEIMSDSQLFPAPLTDTSASMNVLGIYKFLAIFIITQEEKRKTLHTPPRLGYIT